MSSPNVSNIAKQEDTWIPSVCGMCYNQCGIRAHRVDGTVVKIEGNPDSPFGKGVLCPRGLAGIQTLYDPHRVDRPLRRTNPEKGIGVDPQWEEISWDEALDTVTEKLQKVREDDPRKMHIAGSSLSLAPTAFLLGVFTPAFGSPNLFVSNGHHCGNAEHMLARTLHGTLTTNPDADYCDYLLLFGCQAGFGAYYAVTSMSQKIADARDRGMKVVVVDPYLSNAAENADEWIPIRPGTDGAMANAILNLLLNEYGLFDAEYLAHHTDSPYLVESDGDYCRDEETGKPLIWDLESQRPCAFDDEGAKKPALDGSYSVNGSTYKTVLQKLKDRVAKWTPEKAEEVSSVPADTIRRVAREFGEAARIGSTIEIDGHELPLRPAATLYFKGAHGHDNAWLTSMSIEFLNEIVGASNVPGGLLGTCPVSFGHPETKLPRWAPEQNDDGLLQCGLLLNNEPDGIMPGWPSPPENSKLPNLRDMVSWPVSTFMTPLTLNDRENFQPDCEPEVLIVYGSNLLMSPAQPEVCAEAFKKAFVVSFSLYSDETAEALADIVLPDACYLERMDPLPNWIRHHHPVGLGDWGYQIRQPIVEPLGERRHASQVALELGERLGILPTMNIMMNLLWDLKPPHAFDPNEKYTWEEIADRAYQAYFGSARGLKWFKENGVLTWPNKVEEVYWKPFTKARAPLHYGWIRQFGDKIEEIAKQNSLKGIDTSQFSPLPDWQPCQALTPKEGYDFQAIYYRVPWHSFSFTYENPWLDEISQSEPFSYFICINTASAEKLGIHDGQEIVAEGVKGDKIRGRARLTQGIHPEVIGVANNGGHWAKGMPVAKGKGVFFNQLLPLDLEHVDLVSLTMDCDARVRVYRA